MTDESKEKEDRARRFVWEDGDLEFVGNDTDNLPDDDHDDDDAPI